MSTIRPMEFDPRKIIARRAAMELVPDAICNLGSGISTGIATVGAEEGSVGACRAQSVMGRVELGQQCFRGENRPELVERGIPELCLVVLIGISGSGKSTFGRAHFRPTEVISSDYCRGLVAGAAVARENYRRAHSR